MARRNDYYFYLSGAISFAIFGLVITLFFILVLSSDKVKSYALKKDKYIAVSIDLSSMRPSPNDTKKPAPKPVVKPKSAPKPAEPPKTVPDVSSLFSEVWTKKITPKATERPKKIDAKRLSAIEKRIKTTTSKKSDIASKRVKELELVRPAAELVGSSGSSASEVNEYLAKIQAFVYGHFYPPVNSEGNSAKVRIWLDAYGHLSDFKVLARSGSNAFNDEVDSLKGRLKSLLFPKHPKSESITIDIILTAKE